MGFFRDSEILKRSPLPLLPQCGACGLFEGCHSPRMPVDGEGGKGILVVGEAPGATEDRHGVPFVGESGKLLESELDEVGIDLREDCWITNATICRPPKNKLPPRAVEYCRPNLIGLVKDLKPRVIILLGKSALESLMGWLWKENCGSVERWVGWQIPNQTINAWICPTWHPSYLLRLKGPVLTVTQDLFREHLQGAADLTGRPWRACPDYKKLVQCVLSPDEAAATLRDIRSGSIPLTLDYETDRIKPDHPEARILCAAVSDGTRTIAYPWAGEAIQETRRLLWSRAPKMGWNCKFEERWTLARFGTTARNWVFDGMLGAHLLDHRRGIAGLKFQAFVTLGAEVYDAEMKPFMSSENSNSPNSLATKVDLRRLLFYCGKDALLEWQACRKQMEQLNLWRW